MENLDWKYSKDALFVCVCVLVLLIFSFAFISLFLKNVSAVDIPQKFFSAFIIFGGLSLILLHHLKH